MNQTGHRSVQMVRRYIRDGNLFRENSAGNWGCRDLYGPKGFASLREVHKYATATKPSRRGLSLDPSRANHTFPG